MGYLVCIPGDRRRSPEPQLSGQKLSDLQDDRRARCCLYIVHMYCIVHIYTILVSHTPPPEAVAVIDHAYLPKLASIL